MRKHFYLLISFILVVSSVKADLNNTLIEFQSAQDTLSKLPATSPVLDEWISRFKNEIENEKEHTQYYLINRILADIYTLKGDNQSALTSYKTVYNSEEASTQDRFLSGLRIKNLISDPGEWLEFIDSYEDFISKQKQLGANVENFENILTDIDFQRAKKHIDYARIEAKKLNEMGQPDKAEEILFEGFNEANFLLTNYLSDSSKPSLRFGPQALYTNSEVTFALSEYYFRNNMEKEQNEFLEKTITQLESSLEKYPKSVKSNSTAVLLFGIKKRHLSSEEFINYVALKIENVQPSHSLLNYLFDHATSCGKNRDYEQALNFYDLLIVKEQEWFPQDYTEHSNYQIGLLEKAMVEVNMGLLDAALITYKEFSRLNIQDEYLREYAAAFQKKIWGNIENVPNLYFENLNDDEKQNSKQGKEVQTPIPPTKEVQAPILPEKEVQAKITSEPEDHLFLLFSKIILTIIFILIMILLFLKQRKIRGLK